ncbi:YT521-B-like domain-containing protein [Trichoderma ceciliae]
MGDVSVPSDSGTRNVDPILPEPTAASPVVPQSQDHEWTASGHDSHQDLPRNLAVSQHASSPQPGSTPSSAFFNRHSPYNMASLANTLPLDNYHHGQYQRGVQQRYTAGLSPPMAPPMPPIPQYSGPSPITMAPQGYYIPQIHQISPYYGGNHLHVNQAGTTMLQRQNIAYYPNPMAMGHPHTQYYYPQAAPYPIQIPNVQSVVASGQHPRTEIVQPASTGSLTHSQPLDGRQPPVPSQKSTSDEHRGSVRASSRKPRQTGNAVWIGNLPPQTDLMNLVRHVSKETTGLESLFLIAKSNCAFANFKDETSCIAAQLKVHESRFQSVRLVSRLRKNEIEGSASFSAPTGPAAIAVNSPRPINQTKSKASAKIDGANSAGGTPDRAEHPTTAPSGGVATYHDRFFILKSLTADDLELSVRTGVWATQSHNEETLTNAFKQCNNVYLIFSANKSGEYFGYARMASDFNPSLDSTVKFAPVPRSTNEIETPEEILTDATEYVPKGRIIDDPTRGTVFWEIYQEDSEKIPDNENNVFDGKDGVLTEEEEERAWGKPFRVEWISTSRLPFHRIRGLRNPWNSNREVKIARDGTEIEPSAGQRLIGLFNNVQGTRLGVTARPPVAGMSGYQQTGPYAQ